MDIGQPFWIFWWGKIFTSGFNHLGIHKRNWNVPISGNFRQTSAELRDSEHHVRVSWNITFTTLCFSNQLPASFAKFYQVALHPCAKFFSNEKQAGKSVNFKRRRKTDLGEFLWHKTEATAAATTGWQMARHFPDWTLITTNNKHSRSCLESFWWNIFSQKA